jgi:uncharacterized protein (TIGR02266 family)
VVRVVAPGASWTGRAANLSVGGAFITGGPDLDVGRRLTVAIDLGDHRPPIEAHAKVVWTRPLADGDRPAGLGVRFLRIDDEAVRRIDQLVAVQAQAPNEILHGPVRVQLPGLPVRLRASARELTRNVLVVEAELSWLKIGGTISTEVAPGDVRDGRLAWVGVEVAPSGHARLCLNVELAKPPAALVDEPTAEDNSDELTRSYH